MTLRHLLLYNPIIQWGIQDLPIFTDNKGVGICLTYIKEAQKGF
ncbi:hypothetical protein [Treponema vincentii]|nr:hypothetical protein [Treponema vincentii]